MKQHGIADVASSEIVKTCYDIMDVVVIANVTSFTDDKYDGHDERSYLDAHDRQAQWLLD